MIANKRSSLSLPGRCRALSAKRSGLGLHRQAPHRGLPAPQQLRRAGVPIENRKELLLNAHTQLSIDVEVPDLGDSEEK